MGDLLIFATTQNVTPAKRMNMAEAKFSNMLYCMYCIRSIACIHEDQRLFLNRIDVGTLHRMKSYVHDGRTVYKREKCWRYRTSTVPVRSKAIKNSFWEMSF